METKIGKFSEKSFLTPPHSRPLFSKAFAYGTEMSGMSKPFALGWLKNKQFIPTCTFRSQRLDANYSLRFFSSSRRKSSKEILLKRQKLKIRHVKVSDPHLGHIFPISSPPSLQVPFFFFPFLGVFLMCNASGDCNALWKLKLDEKEVILTRDFFPLFSFSTLGNFVFVFVRKC